MFARLFASTDERPKTYHIISIQVPAATSWQPVLTREFIKSIYAISSPIHLQIRGNRADISFRMIVASGNRQATIQTIYAYFPTAQLDTSVWQDLSDQYEPFYYGGTLPFVAPIRSASDFRHYDPLATVISAITLLRFDEEIVYQISLTPMSRRQRRQGRKLVTDSPFTWTNYLTLSGTTEALLHKAIRPDGIARFDEPVQKTLETKLNSPLKAVSLILYIAAERPSRAHYLADMFRTGFAQYSREGFNAIVPHERGAFNLVLSPDEVAALWHPPTEACQAAGIARAPGIVTPLPNEIRQHNRGVLLGEHRYQGWTHRVYLDYRDRITHVNLVGKTRVGKSTLMHHMIHQDIAAGKSVIVIDPHGDLVKDVLGKSIPPTRMKDVIYFDAADNAYALGLNLLAGPSGVPHSSIAGHTVGVFRKLFGSEWRPSRMEDSMYAAILALLSYPGATIRDIPRLFNNPQFRQAVLVTVKDPVALEYWQEEYNNLTLKFQRELARPIIHRVRKLYRDQTLRRILCQPDSFDFQQIFSGNKLFFVNLQGLSEVEADTIGSLLITKIEIAAMRRRYKNSKQRGCYLYIDEVQRFVTSSLPTMLSEAAKSGLNLVIANQFLHQLAGNTLQAVMGNIGTTVLFRLGAYDATALTPFVRPQFAMDDLLNLSRFHTITKMQLYGQTLPAFNTKTLPPLPQPEDYDGRIAQIRQLSREQYARPVAEVDALLQQNRSAYAQYIIPTHNDDSPTLNESGVNYFE